MARYLDSKCRLCRREGTKLFLKGTRCGSPKCALAKRAIPPGMHTRPSGKASYYALQLREKQKAKRLYGMLERQFRRFFSVASKAKGATGTKLMELLERRLDNTLFKSLMALSRNQARQYTLHGFTFVNGKRVNIPSYLVKESDCVEIKAPEKIRKAMKLSIEAAAKERSVPAWIEADHDNLKYKIARMPAKSDMAVAINEQLIIELYSK